MNDEAKHLSEADVSLMVSKPEESQLEISQPEFLTTFQDYSKSNEAMIRDVEMHYLGGEWLLAYKTFDGLEVGLFLRPLNSEEKERLKKTGDHTALEDERGPRYMKVERYQVKGSRGEIDLVNEMGQSGILVMPCRQEQYQAIYGISTSSDIFTRLEYLMAVGASPIDSKGGAITMVPILGKEEIVVFEHELDHYLRHLGDQRMLDLAKKSSDNKKISAAENKLYANKKAFGNALAEEEAAANTGGRIYGQRALDQLDGKKEENGRIAKHITDLSRDAYAQAFPEQKGFGNLRPRFRINL